MSQQVKPDVKPAVVSGAVTIPFELVNNNIFLRIQVNNSEPLSVIFDTGDKLAIIDTARAKSLGLDLQGDIKVGGAGAGTMIGHFVKGGTFAIPGLEGFTQPIALAIPLEGIEPYAGHKIDGIIGADFISQFVIEIDYWARTMKLHNKDNFHYTGKGESIPITFDQSQHLHMRTQIVQTGREPVECESVIDLGSGGAVALTKPFIEKNHIVPQNQKTIETIVGRGAGGDTFGKIGRVDGLKIGQFLISSPITAFSDDTKGAMAGGLFEANIGALIMCKFTIFLDYPHNRIILEPNSHFAEMIDWDISGLILRAEGNDYKTFQVYEIVEHSPAADAGIHKEDVIISVDGRPASEFTLTTLHELFKKPGEYQFVIKRGQETKQLKLTLKRLV